MVAMATKAAAVPAAAQKRAAALREAIETHDHNYYVLDAPTVTDAEYDALYREFLGRGIEYFFPEARLEMLGAAAGGRGSTR